MPTTLSTSEKPRRTRRSRSVIFLWIMVILLAGGLGYMAWLNMGLRKPEAQTKLAQEANQRLVDDVAKIFLVPTNEQPTIAKIADVDSLKKSNAQFYADARNGDTLLIYNSRAIIYRESENKVINVAPVSVSPKDKALEQSNTTNTTNNTTSNEAANNTPATNNTTP